MIKLGSNSIGKIYFGSNSIGKAYYGSDLVFQKGGSPLPYTSVSYIQTDGTAYIDTGINGNYPKSVEMKIVPVAPSDTMALLGSKSSSNNYPFVIAGQWGSSVGSYSNYLYYSYGTITTEGLPIASSITNQTPVIIRSSLGPPTTKFAIKQDGDSSFTEITFATTRQVNSNLNMFLFARNEDGVAGALAASGTKLNYCKIYGDLDLGGTLLFDGVPAYYNGEYGLWDKVSNAFFGNVASSGAFTGPQI